MPIINPCYASSPALQHIRRFIADAATSPAAGDGAWIEPETGARCFATPFPVLQLPRFFASSDVFADALQSEIRAVPLQHRSNDLFDFYQSWDAQALDGVHIQGLRRAMASPPILRFIETVLGVDGLMAGRVDLAAQRYERGGYLLCHDDDIKEEVEAGVARRVAFVYYLVDAAWSAEDGGALALFDTVDGQPGRIVRRLVPERGALVLFRVGETSWHQVEEVRARLAGRARWSVTGWLYGPPPLLDGMVPQFHSLRPKMPLADWICADYLTDAAKTRISEQFINESMVQLQEFLRGDVRDKLAGAMRLLRRYHSAHGDTVLAWQTNGPASLRRYAQWHTAMTIEDASIAEAAQLLNDFDAFLQSEALAHYLQHVTGLSMVDIAASGVFGQLRRVVHGDYTLLRDDWREPSGLDVLLHILTTPDEAKATGDDAVAWPDTTAEDGASWQGAYHYINEEDGDLLATLTPADNALTLVYRDEGVARFLKYSLQEDGEVERLDAMYTFAVDLADDQ
ncbi:Oxoglutarate and iron-dependent oxygenase degradation C-term-domain-containing protein [Syncephalis pseudoplumigaleata]|uniref:Oxoglutarate and iron-dependent oxygenase degradation C-term-domain-containing protein n=1 Tax=Syncephalis pseudoplumigaleata TaxID=1712513 RepID=A0A4P9YW65_9FUNG|nr:Oxoglutarate and iron-dependent oxygenase degradation C-term-domain-containing protein [Syncephalis pseudoplumigaleata]|eukprot:RKP23180.1 Oxoglutarate and iron-dependent oxygenase degradation C-term-domain-containing protein [Syncephalis pseudoplumigaleata]